MARSSKISLADTTESKIERRGLSCAQTGISASIRDAAILAHCMIRCLPSRAAATRRFIEPFGNGLGAEKIIQVKVVRLKLVRASMRRPPRSVTTQARQIGKVHSAQVAKAGLQRKKLFDQR
jgi:hypothetical protein